MQRLMAWVSLGGTAIVAVGAVFAGIMALRAGESVWVSVVAFAAAAVCLGYLVLTALGRLQGATGSREQQLDAEAARYRVQAMGELLAALTDDDPRLDLAAGAEPTSYQHNPDGSLSGRFSRWDSMLDALHRYDYVTDWDWEEPPADVFDWFCGLVGRRWPGVDLRALAAAQGHLAAWTATAYHRDRDDHSVDSPATLDGYLAPLGIRVGWFDNGSASTLFAVSRRGYDRIAALRDDYHLAGPVRIDGLTRSMLKPS